MANIPVALQLYTVRDQTANDFGGTVRRVAEIGYAGIEFAGVAGLNVQAVRRLLSETGLKTAGSHIPLQTFEKSLEAIIVYNKIIGNRFVGVPWLPDEFRNPAGFRKMALRMNRWGAAAREEGLVLYYHNHAFEFEPIEGTRGIDILLAETNPSLVAFECDVYWVNYAGEDPAAFIRAHAGRFPLVHLKDMIGQGEERTFAEVGEGSIDFASIFEASESQGVEWYIVEQDRCARPSLESAQMSLDNLKRWGKA
jgi:sugar phosphate isomerase/epimerase